jgi:tetratricopeptide (TPR) repeat protein
LDPGSKATYNHAIEALENGYVEEALATLLGLSPERGQMRGWIPYFEVLGTAYHLVGRFSDELAVGEEARRRYPDRRYALLPSVRALAALDRVPALKQVLARAATMPSDPYGTTTEQLFLQAGDELHAHGDTARARDFYLQALRSVGKSAIGQLKRQDASIKEAAQRGLGDWGGAAATAKRLVQIDSTDPDSRGFLGAALARTGNISEARTILNDLGTDRRPYLFGGPALAQARIATALGDRDAAITDLARGFAEGWEFDLWVHRDPDFDSLRSLPRFQTLVALKR